ncbi:hypothetical protein TorRG33x02_279060 [Trema orientale]|uniref:Uncharacterized protein n=1 Tax=Trema orientale TaxID=63057 RepID=A0A2P5CND6_TREOI|nr:hypothetical protein TorRG33x02_279060 [Trema orientale]
MPKRVKKEQAGTKNGTPAPHKGTKRRQSSQSTQDRALQWHCDASFSSQWHCSAIPAAPQCQIKPQIFLGAFPPHPRLKMDVPDHFLMNQGPRLDLTLSNSLLDKKSYFWRWRHIFQDSSLAHPSPAERKF